MMEVPTGSHIRRWRKSLEITQTKLSDMSGVAQSIIAKIENEVVDPRASTLRKLLRLWPDLRTLTCSILFKIL